MRTRHVDCHCFHRPLLMLRPCSEVLVLFDNLHSVFGASCGKGDFAVIVDVQFLLQLFPASSPVFNHRGGFTRFERHLQAVRPHFCDDYFCNYLDLAHCLGAFFDNRRDSQVVSKGNIQMLFALEFCPFCLAEAAYPIPIYFQSNF